MFETEGEAKENVRIFSVFCFLRAMFVLGLREGVGFIFSAVGTLNVVNNFDGFCYINFIFNYIILLFSLFLSSFFSECFFKHLL